MHDLAASPLALPALPHALELIPAEDAAVFVHLPAKARHKVEARWPALDAVLKRRIKARDGWRIAGLPRQTFCNLLTRARTEGWQCTIDKALLGASTQKVLPHFLPLWHGYVLGNQRNTAAAHARMCRDAAQGKPIPGYEHWTKWPQPPPGLTKENLCRARYLPAPAERVLARQGIAAARAELPCVPMDVSHLRPLEWVVFDDVEVDFLVVVRSGQPAVKLRLIVAFDLATRRILGYAARPAITRADGKEDGLKLRDMKAVVVKLLRTYGIPSAYVMHLLCERGTAAIKEPFKAALAEASFGMIAVHDTGMIAGTILGYPDGGKGNSWAKGWLESYFNSLHNELQFLPGQKGRRYDLQPAELDGRKAEAAALARVGRHIPLALRTVSPFLHIDEALPEIDAAFLRCDERTDHDLQGFLRVGTWQFHPDDKPKTQDDLYALLEAGHAIETAKLLWSSRMEMPRERWQRMIVDCPRVMPDECTLHLLLDAHTEPVTFTGYQFSFKLDGTQYTYLPPATLLPHLVHGEKYVVWCHPQAMDRVYLTRARPHLGYLGVLTRFTRARYGDTEATAAALRETKAALGHSMQRVKDARLGVIEQGIRDRQDIADQIEAGLAAEEERAAALVPPSPETGAPVPQIARIVADDRRSDARRRAEDHDTSPAAALARMAAACGAEEDED